MAREKPTVRLVSNTPDPKRVIASAARLCYASDVEGLFKDKVEEPGKFIRMLGKMGHLSPFEHATFTFYLQGVSRAMTHQLVRHRIASYSQRSQRYVDHENFSYILPPKLRGKTVETEKGQMDAEKYFHETMEMIRERYGKLNQALGEKGREDARYVLPNACETKITVSMNARELMHFFQLRLCQRAQWEIRSVADKMLSLLKKKAPAIFENVGPSCVFLGYCPEGKMSCNQMEKMREKYLD